MEFNFEIQNIFSGQITVIASEASSNNLRIYDVELDKSSKCKKNWTYTQMANNAPMYKKMQRMKQQLENVVDEMGIASAQAQGLHTPITSLDKLLHSNQQQRVYVIKDTESPKVVIGILKIGIKDLYLSDENGTHYEISPLCILDFYVHETKQRQGFGHTLFDSMLKAENLTPDKLAIDRPSSKLLSFLKKHYGLKGAISQANNFVVYPSFFHNIQVHQKNKRNTLKHLQNSQANSSESEDSKETQLLPSSESSARNRYTSNTEMLLHWDVESKTALDNVHQVDFAVTETNKKSNLNWGVNDAMHSYHESSHNAKRITREQSYESPKKPVTTTVQKSCNKWDQLQTSWNVLGVKPHDYSKFQNNNISEITARIIAGRLS